MLIMSTKRYTFNLLLLGFFTCLLLSLHSAEYTVGWRGNGTGHYETANSPTSWSKSKNIIWQTPLATFSNSLPIILNNRLYVGAERDKLVCLDTITGKIIWEKSNAETEILSPAQRAEQAKTISRLQPVKAKKKLVDHEYNQAQRAYRKDRTNKELGKKVRKLKKEQRMLTKQLAPLLQFLPKTHRVTGYSTPTPVTDGKNIYTCYGTGMAAAYTPAGKRLWLRVIEKPIARWGFSTSPVFADGKFIVAYQHIIALDPLTGKELWRVPSKYHWGSLLKTSIDGKTVIITPNGEIIRAADGMLLSKSLPALAYNSAMIYNQVVYTYDKNRARAHRLPDKAEAGAKAKLLWEVPISSNRYYSSPVTDGKTVYCITRAGILTALDIKTGKKIFERKIKLGRGTNYPSPTIAGNRLLVSSDNGKTVVLKLDANGTEITENSLSPFRSSPVFVGNRMYIRTLDAVYCIGKK